MRLAADWDEQKYRAFVERHWDPLMARGKPHWLDLTVHTEAPVSRRPEVELHVREDDPTGKALIDGFTQVFGTTWTY